MLFNCNSFTLVANKYLLTYLLQLFSGGGGGGGTAKNMRREHFSCYFKNGETHKDVQLCVEKNMLAMRSDFHGITHDFQG